MPFLQEVRHRDRPEIDKLGVKVAFVNYPLPIHPKAMDLAAIGLCSSDFWRVHDRMFNGELVEADPTCTGSSGIKRRIDDEISLAKRLNIHGTPSFVLGVESPTGTVKSMEVITGAQPPEVFKAEIAKLQPLHGSRHEDEVFKAEHKQ
jgi:hypothetical protein